MSDPELNCVYVTPKFVEDTKSKGTKSAMDGISMYPIEIAFMQPGVPLSDLVRGIFGIMPPELLHTTCEGITMYIIDIISTLLGNDNVGEEAKNVLDSLHQ